MKKTITNWLPEKWRRTLQVAPVMALLLGLSTLSNAQYCVPANGGAGCGDDIIANFTLGTINNTTTCVNAGYGDYSSISTDLPNLPTNNVASVTSGVGTLAHGISIWIDFNNNQIFETSERVATTGNTVLPSTTTNLTLDFTNATLGSHRLRVIYRYAQAGTSHDPCAGYSGNPWQDVEDYTVNIVAAPCTPPSVTYALVPDCGNNQFSVNVNITNMGDATSIAIQEGATTFATANATGTYSAGPFTSGSNHTLMLAHNTNALCNISSPVQTYACPPLNDDCAGAVSLTTNPDYNCGSTANGTTVSATQSTETAPTVSPTGTNDDVWYKFVATSTSHRVTLTNVSGSTDMAMAIYSGSCGSLVHIQSSDPYSMDVTGLSIGTEYKIRVYTNAATVGTAASFTICVGTQPPPPPNDNCAGAIAFPTIPTNGSCVMLSNQTTAGATNSNVTPTGSCSSNSGNPDDDVWFSFVAPDSIVFMEATNVSGATDVYWQVFSGSCSGSMTSILCTDANAGGTISGLTIGTTYYIRLYTYAAASITTENICLKTRAPMTYVSSTTTQAVTTSVTLGATNQQIIGVEIVVIGSLTSLSLTQLDFNTTGSTNAMDITSAKVYSTGTSSSFAATTAFGSPVANPNGSFSVTGTQALTGGTSNTTNYFWLVYDVSCTAVATDVLDAQCTAVTIGAPQTPTITNPAGSRTITAGTVPSYTATTSTNVAPGTADLTLGRTNIVGSNCATSVTEVRFNTATSPVADISKAKCYYTTTSTFSAATPFGAPVLAPGGDVTFNGSQTLAAGSGNYFWLTYDVSCSGVAGDSLVAVPVSITSNAGTATIVTPATNAKKGITGAPIFSSTADGDWNNPATWACGSVPTSATNVIINNNVTVTTSGNTSANITINAGKSLTVSGGDLTMGPIGGGNKTLTNNGTLAVSAGTLNVNGNVSVSSSATFNQSGGNINIDGNAAGVTANSVASGTYLLNITSQNINWTGGILTIVDPHAASGTTNYALYFSNSTSNVEVGTGHTFRLGDGVSADPAGSANGFLINNYVSSTRINLGNVIINGPSTGNRMVTSTYSFPVKGNLQISNNGTFNTTTITHVGGNLTVDAGSSFISTSTLSLAAFSGTSTTSAVTIPQNISGAGAFKNNATTSTANFTSLTVNNSSASGVTFADANSLLSGTNTGTVSGTLTMTAGMINTGTNALVLGISPTAAGTYSYTAGMIVGKFKRWITAATGSRVFNLGNSAGTKTATINFTTAPTAAGSLTAEWLSGDPGTAGLPLTEGSNNLAYVSTIGYWRVSAGDGLTGGTYTATFNGVGIADVSDYSQLAIGKRATAGNNWSLDGTHVAPTGSNANFVISRTGIATGFSEFGILMGGVPLPVDVAFTGKNAGSVNNLDWKTSSEVNFSHFELQRSTDGTSFSKLATISSKGITTGSQYSYTDEHPVDGKNYYRLNMVDRDGKSAFSDIVVLVAQSGTSLAVHVHPNPVSQQLNVEITGTRDVNARIMVLDITGKVLQTIPANNNVVSVDMSRLSSGIYMIRYTDNSHNTVIKVNKN